MNDITIIFTPCCFPLIFVALVLILLYFSSVYEKRKIAEYQAFARANGFEFRPLLSEHSAGNWFDQLFASTTTKHAFLQPLTSFRPITTIGGNVKYCFTSQTNDTNYTAFQYSYSTGSGKNRTTHYYTVALVDLPISAPGLEISNEDVFDKIGKVFGGQDIELENFDFNQRFRIKSPDEKFAHDVLHPQMMEWFMAVNPPGFQWQANRIVLYESGNLDLQFVLNSRAQLHQFWNLIPDFVKQDHG